MSLVLSPMSMETWGLSEFLLGFVDMGWVEVVDDIRPQVEDVVARKGRPLLAHRHRGPQEGSLNGRAEAAGAAADYHNLSMQTKAYFEVL